MLGMAQRKAVDCGRTQRTAEDVENRTEDSRGMIIGMVLQIEEYSENGIRTDVDGSNGTEDISGSLGWHSRQ